MKHRILSLALLLAATPLAHAHQHGHAMAAAAAPASGAPDGVSIDDCWIRAMPANLPSAGYFIVRNRGEQPVQLTGIAADAFGHSMLHQTVQRDGMSRMEMAHDIQVPAKGELAFTPGGYHAMLEQPHAELTVGSTLPVAFHFGQAGQLTAECTVRPPGATGNK